MMKTKLKEIVKLVQQDPEFKDDKFHKEFFGLEKLSY